MVGMGKVAYLANTMYENGPNTASRRGHLCKRETKPKAHKAPALASLMTARVRYRTAGMDAARISAATAGTGKMFCGDAVTTRMMTAHYRDQFNSIPTSHEIP